MRISINGINLIKEFEGLRLEAYQDIVGVWTIGYGHTGSDVHPGLTIDDSIAVELLHLDLRKFEDGLNSMVKVELTQNQFDALMSFVYNVGLGGKDKSGKLIGFAGSTMLKFLNVSDFLNAALEFPKWRKAGGKVQSALVDRRKKEQELFESQSP